MFVHIEVILDPPLSLPPKQQQQQNTDIIILY